MSIGIVLLHVGLVVVTFMLMLNAYLRGAAKAKADAILSLMWIGLLGLSLILFGWRSALIALVLSFVYSRAAVTPARAVARRMLGYRTVLTTVDAPVDFSVEGLLRGNEKDNRRVVQIAKRARIARVLNAHGLTSDDLREQYWFLMSSGLGDLSWEVVSTPSDLELLLDLRRQGLEPVAIAARLMRAK